MATFKGIISHALPEQSGVSRNGNNWRKRTYVLTYDNLNANYPKAVVFDVMNSKIDELNIQQGVEYEVEVDFAVREYQGKYYQSASAWKATPMQPVAQPAPQPPVYAQTQPQGDMGDPLPF
nr:DUF3127 domain-containing protein [Bacteroides acidifaciens]